VVSDVFNTISQVFPLVSLLRVEGEQVSRRVFLLWREVWLRVSLDAEDTVDLVFQLRERVRGGRVSMVMIYALGAPVFVLDRGQAARGVGKFATGVYV
jgi:hypothetical protein